MNLSKYAMVDLLLGNEKDDGHSLYYYKTFKPALRQQLTKYLNNRGKLFVSGSYLASDMQGVDEQDWLKNNLKITFDGANYDNYNSVVSGMGMSFDVYRTINEEHYGAYTPDYILPVDNAFSTLTYADGKTAAVAYKGLTTVFSHYPSHSSASRMLLRVTVSEGYCQLLNEEIKTKKLE